MTRTVDDLQSTIEDIRTAIFELQFPRRIAIDLRQRIRNAVDTLTDHRDITTTFRFSGPMSVVGVDLADHVEAVITEAVSTAVSHSGTSRMMIEVGIADELAIDIIDNGSGNLAPTSGWPPPCIVALSRSVVAAGLPHPQGAVPMCAGSPR